MRDVHLCRVIGASGQDRVYESIRVVVRGRGPVQASLFCPWHWLPPATQVKSKIRVTLECIKKSSSPRAIAPSHYGSGGKTNMSTMLYSIMTTLRDEAAAKESTSTAPPGVDTFLDAVAVLVPAGMLGGHAVMLAWTTTMGGRKHRSIDNHYCRCRCPYSRVLSSRCGKHRAVPDSALRAGQAGQPEFHSLGNCTGVLCPLDHAAE